MPVPGDAPVGAGGVPNGSGDGDGRWESSNEVPPPPTDRGNGGDDESGDGGSGGNGEFEEALGDFDGAILSEREGAGERNPNLPRTGGGGIPGDAETGVPGSADGTEDSSEPGSGQEPVLANVPTAPTGRVDNSQSDPSDARDDDIIARQLREAAMAESDPELKAALWEEYERYKNN
ncbi:MAG: hypothetical protein NXH85_12915 [Pseudomonadaceae bacterium]|nr:hypothetical protein [Pseudomonadaceae bacterium]